MRLDLAPIHDFHVHYFGDPALVMPSRKQKDAGVVLWFACSDLGFRIDNLVGSVRDFHTVQNLGNTVPAQGTASTSTLTTLWFALLNYDVRHLVVCGHVPCPVLRNVVGRARRALNPEVQPCFAPLLDTLRRHYAGLDPIASLEVATQENVLLQLENLLTHEIVRKGLDESRFKLHGWILGDAPDSVSRYNPQSRQFEPCGEAVLSFNNAS